MTLADGQSSGSVVAALLPARAHYVKAFGALRADALRQRQPRPAPGALIRRPVRRSHVAGAGGSVSAAMHAVSRRRI